MYKLMRLFNQNKRTIFVVILVVVLIIVLLQLLNYLAGKKINTNIQNGDNTISNNNIPELISNKSAVSGGTISSSKLEECTEIIDKFINYCNKAQIEEAYNLLTEECKEEMFPTIEDFNNIYYSPIFNGESKSYTLENWLEDTYQVRITEDILATGKVDNSSIKQDYVTVIEKNGEYKLNINSYIERKKINKTTENKGIKVIVNSKDTYMDYEKYNLTIENNSGNSILLDDKTDTKSVYLKDSKDVKYYFYGNEIIDNQLIIQNKFKRDLQIKFANKHSSSRIIKRLVFSRLVLNYDEYRKTKNKTEYEDIIEFYANV